jgi:hypothetical protein
LHVRIGDTNDGNWGVDTRSVCRINQPNTFSLECRGSAVTVRLNNEVIQVRQPTKRATGLASVFAGDGFYPTANASIANFKFTALN